MEDIDWEFLKNLILILIPLVAGSILTPIFLHRIQDRNVKIERKKELIHSFVHSAKAGFARFDTLFRRISEEYADVIDTKNYTDTKEVKFTLNDFPTDEKEFPKNKFADKLRKLDEDLTDIRIVTSEFISLSNLYVDDSSFLEDYQKINTQLTVLWFKLKKWLNVTTKEEFGNNMREISQERTNAKKLIVDFENKLISVKIRTVPV